MSRGLRASLTDGRVHLEDAAMTVGGLAVRLGGTLATDRSAGTLVLDVDGDLGSLGPWVTRLGGTHATDVRARLIASSATGVEQAVDDGSLRADLFHRLSVLPVVIPPLRERTEDILPLA